MPLFGHSSLNYYAGYKSLIGYDWAWERRSGRYTPEIHFTDQEVGRRVMLEFDGVEQEVALEPIVTKRVTLSPNAVHWGSLYRKPGRGVFGNVEEEGVDEIDPKAADSRWTEVNDFRYGKEYTEAILPRGSVVFLQEIESPTEQTIAIKVTNGNAAYILLNGEYVTAHFSPERKEKQEELLLLPLKKGNNQLVVKFYNGFENRLHYGIEPLEEWVIHSQTLKPVRLERKDFHRVSLRAADASSHVSPLRMNNVTIR
jgi:alpha-L-fucosidase